MSIKTLWFAAAIVLMLGLGSLAVAQQPTFDINWDNQPVSAALEQLQRAFGVQYTLPAELANQRVTVNRQGVTVAQALQELAQAANMRVLADPSGRFVFQPAQQAAAPAATGWGQYQAQPQNPWATPGASYQMPAPMRPGQPTAVQPQVPTMPGVGMPMPGQQPGMPGLAPGQLMTVGGQMVDASEVALRVLELNHMSPELAAMLFGGYPIYDMGGMGGAGGYGGGYGGGGGYDRGGYDRGTSGYDRGGRGTTRQSGYGTDTRGTTGRSSRTRY